jgi:biopolymer transport protein ExbB/TolQ
MRNIAFAPFIGLAATSYGLYRAFQIVDTSGATWATAVEGLLSSLAATGVLGLVWTSLVGVYDLVSGGGRGDGAA